MSEKKFIDNNGLAHFWLLLKERFVRKELKTGSTSEYKVMSDNNLTDELVRKIQNAGDSSFSGNYDDLIGKPTIPTNNNQLTNGAGYQTADDVSAAISSAIQGVTQFDYSIVTNLPTTGAKGTIYLVANSGSGNNKYDEYIWVNNAFEKFGTTEVDLSGLVKEEDLVAITNTEIDTIVAS